MVPEKYKMRLCDACVDLEGVLRSEYTQSTERTWTLLFHLEVGKPEAEPFMECFFEKLESSQRRGTSANYKAIVKQALIEKSV